MRPLPETVVLGGGCKRRQKLKQYTLVVGDYFAEQTGIGLAQEIVRRGANQSDKSRMSRLILTHGSTQA